MLDKTSRTDEQTANGADSTTVNNSGVNNSGVNNLGPVSSGSPDTSLMNQILEATEAEQAGDVITARRLYQEVIAADSSGTFGLMAQQALEAMQGDTDEQTEVIVAPVVGPSIPKVSWWQSLKLRGKLTAITTGVAALAIVALTVVNTLLSRQEQIQAFDEEIRQTAVAFEEEYVFWISSESVPQAASLARLIQNEDIDLSNSDSVRANRLYLNSVLFDAFGAFDEESPELTKSFRVILNREGRTLVQFAQLYAEDFSVYPPLPIVGETNTEYRTVSQPAGSEISDLAIVEAVFETEEPLTSVELFPLETLQRLGLAPQAAVEIRPEALEPSQPPGTKVENGLVSMAIHPVTVTGGEVVGAVMVGSLMSRSHALTDNFLEIYQIPIVSIFTDDILVSTTQPYSDGTRAIGTRMPPEAATALFQNNQAEYIDTLRINNEDVRMLFKPLRNFQDTIVGAIAVGERRAELQASLFRQIAINSVVGLGLLVLVALISIRVAEILARPIRDLANLAQQIGRGDYSAIQFDNRQDEIGTLAIEMNQMSTAIQSSLDEIRRQEEYRRQDAEEQRHAKEELQQGVINLLLDIEGARQGDLTVRAPITDGAVGSIADAFNTTIDSLRQLVIQVQEVTAQVNNLAQHGTESVQTLSSVALEQSEEIAGALTAVDTVDRSIQQVAQSAKEAAFIAQKAAMDAQVGDQSMETAASNMEKVRKTVLDTSFKVEQLTQSSQEIVKIASIISGISEKTHLLAFNASVEAMRAGEHGQGFRVVADEVRRLAQQVTEATKSIEQLANTIQVESTDVQQAMAESTTQVTEGSKLASQVQLTLQDLATVSQQIDRYLQTISGSTIDQSAKSRELSHTMQQVVTTAQETAQDAQVVATSLQSLVLEVQNLYQSMSRFRLES